MDFNQVLSAIFDSPTFKLFILWIGLGLTVGVAAKIIIPGSEEVGWIRTILMGLAGSFLGNYVAPKFLDWPTYSAFSLQGVAIGIAGALVLVVINRIVTKS